jgi:hypothetical protein
MLVNLTLHGTTSAEIRFNEEGQAFIVVAKSLRPRLRGVLAECVDEILNATDETRFSDLSLWNARWRGNCWPGSSVTGRIVKSSSALP